MAEQTVWRGMSSQWKNVGAFILWAVVSLLLVCSSFILWRAANPQIARIGPFLLLLLVAPIMVVVARYLKTSTKIYELTTERLKFTQGLFSKVTDTLELYRVKDIETRQPFVYRLVGIENVQLNTSDTSSPFVLIDAIPCRIGLADKIRNEVENIRQQKGVREIDIE
jgi:membrane protein YdbS with pleckstrin-like domain